MVEDSQIRKAPLLCTCFWKDGVPVCWPAALALSAFALPRHLSKVCAGQRHAMSYSTIFYLNLVEGSVERCSNETGMQYNNILSYFWWRCFAALFPINKIPNWIENKDSKIDPKKPKHADKDGHHYVGTEKISRENYIRLWTNITSARS